VIARDADLPPAAHPDLWAGQPGTRVPHVWIDRRDQRLSTVDLFTEGLTLVSADVRWIEVARSVSQATGIAIRTVHVGTDVYFPADRGFEMTFGVSAEGACLVRPDAIVAWRVPGLDADLKRELSRVLTQMTGLGA
jgi:putative polyketide hydroxylase